MQTESYKKRAVDVRRLARANLIEIRKARMARKSAISALPVSAPEPVMDIAPGANDALTADQASVQNDDAAEVDSLDELAIKNAALAEMDGPVTAVSDVTEVASAAPEQTATELDQPAADPEDIPTEVEEIAREPEQAFSETLAEQAIAEPEHIVAEPEQDGAAVAHMIAAEDWAESDLAQLPGAGPGLIWMLAQCEIETLAQLATQNAAELTERLGVVGQILDVGQWISFAQENG